MTWEYLAGFFDGEGCICICKRGNSHRTLLTINNCNKEVMDKIDFFLLTSSYRKRKVSTFSRKPIYVIDIREQQQIKVILKGMLPYLIVKKRKAELMIEYIDTVGGQSGVPLTQEVINKRKEYADKMTDNYNE